MKKYRLKKDLPGIPAGTKFDFEKGNMIPGTNYIWDEKQVPYFFSDWFEEIKEEPEWIEEQETYIKPLEPEETPSPKTIRKWPALIKRGNGECFSTILFSSIKTASLYCDLNLIKWPANENIYVDVPMEDKE